MEKIQYADVSDKDTNPSSPEAAWNAVKTVGHALVGSFIVHPVGQRHRLGLGGGTGGRVRVTATASA